MGGVTTRLLLSTIILFVVGTACGDPGAIDRAEANKMVLEAQAEIEATRIAQAHKLEMERAQEGRTAAEWETNYETNVVRKDLVLFGLSALLVVGVGALGLILLVRMRLASRYAAEALGVYTLQKADLASRLIKIDERTRTWPALLTEGGIHQLETGRVFLLEAPRDADAQAEWASLLIRALGIAERGARATKGDPASLEALGAIVSSVPPSPHSGGERTPLVPSHSFSPLVCGVCHEETTDLKTTKSPDGDLRVCPECRAELLQAKDNKGK